MPDTELITIGAFARASGLSASALRFYADAGVLVPAVVDEATGYRYYAPEQSAPARLLRHLRAVDMPLPAVTTLLAEPDPTRAIALLDHHLADLDRHRDAIRAAATAARDALFARRAAEPGRTGGGRSDQGCGQLDGRADARSPLAAVRNPEPEREVDRAPSTSAEHRDELWVSGPVLAAAIDQVATATVADSDLAVLDTILFETDGQQLTLTATDRYRLATRTVRPTRACTAGWDATVDADDLRAAASWLRRRHAVAIHPQHDRIEFRTAITDSHAAAVGERTAQPAARPNDTRRNCRRSTHDFPDYRAMLAALPSVRTRVVLTRAALLDAMEHAGSPTVVLHADPAGAVSVIASSSWSEHAALADGDATDSPVAQDVSRADYRAPATGVAAPIQARITGPAMTIHFAVTTLYPAIATAVGPDVMLDFIAPDQPALIRSADDGDLLTLAMPCRPAR